MGDVELESSQQINGLTSSNEDLLFFLLRGPDTDEKLSFRGYKQKHISNVSVSSYLVFDDTCVNIKILPTYIAQMYDLA